MKMKTILVISSILSIFSGKVFALDSWENSEKGARSGIYSFLVYAETWQPTFCLIKNNSACKNDVSKFYVHGIWPYFSYQKQKNDKDNSSQLFYNYHPEYCIASPGCNDKKLSCSLNIHVKTLLLNNQYFRNAVTSIPEELMMHEWKKHGTCYGGDQYKYFTDFYKLRNKVVRYNKDKFSLAIGKETDFKVLKSWFPSNVRFRCFIKNDKQYLYEVFYLVDSNGKAFNDNSDKILQIGNPCELKKTIIPVMPRK